MLPVEGCYHDRRLDAGEQPECAICYTPLKSSSPVWVRCDRCNEVIILCIRCKPLGTREDKSARILAWMFFALKAMRDFEVARKKIQAQSNISQAELKAMQEQVLKLGR